NAAVQTHVELRAAVLEGEILVDDGDIDGARARFDHALTLARDHAPAIVPDILFVSTVTAWAQGDISLALARQAELVRWHDTAYTPHRQAHARALWNLADLHLEAGDLDAALRAIRRAHEVRGVGDDADDDARQLLSEAEVLLRRGELE